MIWRCLLNRRSLFPASAGLPAKNTARFSDRLRPIPTPIRRRVGCCLRHLQMTYGPAAAAAAEALCREMATGRLAVLIACGVEMHEMAQSIDAQRCKQVIQTEMKTAERRLTLFWFRKSGITYPAGRNRYGLQRPPLYCSTGTCLKNVPSHY